MSQTPNKLSPPTGHHLPKLDIIVLDDDVDFSQYLEDILKDEGHTVRALNHPQDLFNACEQRLPDVVFLDMKMGEFRGEHVLEQIRQRWPNLCVIILTGYPSMENMRATFKLQVFDYLTKPFSLAEIRDTLARAVQVYSLGQTDQDRLREQLGHRIKMLRTERKWALKDLANASGLSVSQLSSIERGIHLPSLEGLLAISSAFGKRPSALLADTGF